MRAKKTEKTEVELQKPYGTAKKKVHFHCGISCHLPWSSSPCFALATLDNHSLTLFLEASLFWYYISLIWLTLPSLILLTQLNLLQSVYSGCLLHHWQVLPHKLGQFSTTYPDQVWWSLSSLASLNLLLLVLHIIVHLCSTWTRSHCCGLCPVSTQA